MNARTVVATEGSQRRFSDHDSTPSIPVCHWPSQSDPPTALRISPPGHRMAREKGILSLNSCTMSNIFIFWSCLRLRGGRWHPTRELYDAPCGRVYRTVVVDTCETLDNGGVTKRDTHTRNMVGLIVLDSSHTFGSTHPRPEGRQQPGASKIAFVPLKTPAVDQRDVTQHAGLRQALQHRSAERVLTSHEVPAPKIGSAASPHAGAADALLDQTALPEPAQHLSIPALHPP